MAPLVPDLISPQFDFVIAFLMGIGFGFMLEQAGFSSTRKLVGLFYGYDFTVLKVFFTAGITALTGVLLFGHLGFLNLNVIYVNPMYINSAIIGGLIMGLGFVVGGFCPGTSLCALAVGRIDALFFVFGSVFGILAFAEFYPSLEAFYNANNMGAPKISDTLGMSDATFGIALTIIAVAAFIGTSWIQDKVKGEHRVRTSALKRNYVITISAPILIFLVIQFTPNSIERLNNKVESRFESQQLDGIKTMNTDKLAFELMYHAPQYVIIDVTEADSVPQSIPTAAHVKFSELSKPQYKDLITQKYKTNIFVAENLDLAEKAAILSQEKGNKTPVVFTETVSSFRDKVFNVKQPELGAAKADIDRYRFYKNASLQLKQMEERMKLLMEPPKKVVRKAKGGCA